MQKQKLPNSNAVLILGILSILTCCCFSGVIGVILGIVTLVVAKKDMARHAENPDLYEGFSNLNTGRILAIIGLILSMLFIIFSIFLFATLGEKGIKDFEQNLMEKLKYEQENQ